ncbi:hypothetical protein [Rhodoglobus aureus]|uniref:MFS transporter n=1 Tax=Rhodoglobus aureus TaxID=191497 RepID=A0ABN1VYC4_9MICO
MHTRAMRVLRGSAAAVFATFAAALSHQLAGGVAPSMFGMTVSLVISIAVCTLLAGRTVSLVRLTIAILASQAMYHTLFNAMLAPQGIARHDMSAMTLDFSSAAQTANSAMSATHLIAAVVTIVMFRYAEVAFWGLLATARLFLARLLTSMTPVRVHGAHLRLPLHAPHVPTFATRFLSAMRYRGPPVATFAA